MRALTIRIICGTSIVLAALCPFHIVAQSAKLEEAARYTLRCNVVRGETGHPAAGVEIGWTNFKGADSCLISDSEGYIEATLDYTFGWLSILYGRHDGLVTQVLYLSGEDALDTELVLGPAAAVKGAVQRVDGTPLERCTVQLKPDPRLDYALFETRTDANGRYVLDNLPPGTYFVLIDHAGYFSPPVSGDSLPASLSLEAGELAEHNTVLLEKAHVNGRVLGPEGTGASGVSFTITNGLPYGSETRVTTGTSGNFSTDFVPAERTNLGVCITSTELGSGSAWIPPTKPGGVVENLNVQLHGVARVTGTVRGRNGEPIVGVRVRNSVTDQLGRYDTGLVALDSKGKLKVNVSPQVWRGAFGTSRFMDTYPIIEPDALYYHKASFSLAAKHGELLTKDVVLKPMVVRTIRGMVRDVTGNAAADIEVVVYGGIAKADQWLADLSPIAPQRPDREPQLPSCSYLPIPPLAVLLARARSDEEGRWEVRVLPETDRGGWLQSKDKLNPNEFTVAAADRTLEHVALTRIAAEGGADTPIEVNLDMASITDDLRTEVIVSDETGAPLPDVAWNLNVFNGPFVSGADGRLTLPRIDSWNQLRLAKPDRRIASAVTRGNVLKRTRPASDPATSEKNWLEDSQCFQLGILDNTMSPNITVDEGTVSFREFDTRKGSLIVSLSSTPNR